MPYANPAEKRRKDAEYRAKNRSLLAEKQAHRYHNGDKAKAFRAAEKWRAQNPVQAKAITFCNSANRRARRWSTEPEKLFARELLAAVPLAWGCAYCKGPAETWDHAVPLCLGGPNRVDNLNPTCHPCNRRKGRRKIAALWRPSGDPSGRIAEILR